MKYLLAFIIICSGLALKAQTYEFHKKSRKHIARKSAMRVSDATPARLGKTAPERRGVRKATAVRRTAATQAPRKISHAETTRYPSRKQSGRKHANRLPRKRLAA